MPAAVHRISSYVKSSLQLKKRDLLPTSEQASEQQANHRPTDKQIQLRNLPLKEWQWRMDSWLKLQLHARAYTPNYQNPDAALEGILGGTASAETPSTSTVTAVVTEAVVTPAS
jgi:hypothetical protein